MIYLLNLDCEMFFLELTWDEQMTLRSALSPLGPDVELTAIEVIDAKPEEIIELAWRASQARKENDVWTGINQLVSDLSELSSPERKSALPPEAPNF